MTEVEITVRTTVNPTEDPAKVETAIRNLLGDIPLRNESQGDSAVIEGSLSGLEALEPFRDALSRARIRDAARSLLTRITQDGLISFGLNKQAAFAGQASFHGSGESPLGPIQLTIRGDMDVIIGFLCGSGSKRRF